jgi:hypothetical protein
VGVEKSALNPGAESSLRFFYQQGQTPVFAYFFPNPGYPENATFRSIMPGNCPAFDQE